MSRAHGSSYIKLYKSFGITTLTWTQDKWQGNLCTLQRRRKTMYSVSNIPNTESEYGEKLNSITTDDTWTYQNGNWTCALIYKGNPAFLALATYRESCIWALSSNKPSGWYLCNQPMKTIFQGARGYSSWYKCTTVRGTSDYNIYMYPSTDILVKVCA